MTAAASVPALAGLDRGRDLGLVEWFRELLTPVVTDAVYVVTQLGDTWLLLVVLALFYWFGPDRRRGALAAGLAVGSLALVAGLKAWFALSRPDLAVVAVDGYGFPSGHALGSTVVWGSLAVLADGVWTRRRRVAGAGGVVAAVSASRVALGVHYAGDVLAGVAVGVAFLVVGFRVARGDPLRAFALAAALALAALGAGATADGVAALGAALGGAAAWRYAAPLDRPVRPATAVGALVVLGGLWAVVTAVEPALPLVLFANAVAVGGLLGLPAVEFPAAASVRRRRMR